MGPQLSLVRPSVTLTEVSRFVGKNPLAFQDGEWKRKNLRSEAENRTEQAKQKRRMGNGIERIRPNDRPNVRLTRYGNLGDNNGKK